MKKKDTQQPDTEEQANSSVTLSLSHWKICASLVGTELVEKAKFPSSIDIKCFYQNDGKVFFGILLMETTDSFLIGAPARLGYSEDKTISAHPVTTQPVLRLMKTSNRFVALAEDHKIHYLEYLVEEGAGLLPDLLTKPIMTAIKASIKESEKSVKEPPRSKKGGSSGEAPPVDDDCETLFFPVNTSVH